MAGETIYAAFAQLRQTAARMKHVSDSLKRAEHILGEIVTDMQPSWEGRAREKYMDETVALKRKIDRFSDLLEERRIQLEESLKVYERIEGENQKEAEDLSASGIF